MRLCTLTVLLCVITLHASTVTTNNNDFNDDLNLIINTVSPEYKSRTEQEIVYRQLHEFLSYVRKFKGKRKWNMLVKHFQSSKSITSSLIHIYGSTPYQLAGVLAGKLGKKFPDKDHAPLIKKRINEFELIFQENSIAHRDSEYIEYLITHYYQQLTKVFFTSDTIKKRYYKNITNLKDSTIKLYLLTNKKQIRERFGNVRGIAAALVGHEYSDSLLKINTRLLYKYHGLFTMSALVHELTHALWALSYIQPEYTTPLDPNDISERKKKELENAFKPFSSAAPLKEGIAEYMNAHFNLLAKYGFLENVDLQLHHYFKKTGSGFNLSELSTRIYDMKDNAPTYEVAHSLFNYLCNNYGFDKALKLSYSTQQESDYYEILGVDLPTISREWNNYIASEQNRHH